MPAPVTVVPAAMMGALLLMLSDLAARRVFAPTELPVGILTGILGARLTFELRPGLSNEDIRLLLARRKATQPIGEWSCGSVFTNPPGDHAARLIDTAGLKGHRIGGARFSQMHANFIVTSADARRSWSEPCNFFGSDRPGRASRIGGALRGEALQLVGRVIDV